MIVINQGRELLECPSESSEGSAGSPKVVDDGPVEALGRSLGKEEAELEAAAASELPLVLSD